MCSVVDEWSILWMSVRSNWSSVKSKSRISLLLFYLDDLSNTASGTLKYPIIILWLIIFVGLGIVVYESGSCNVGCLYV